MMENEKTQRLKVFQDEVVAPIRKECSALFDLVLKTRIDIEYGRDDRDNIYEEAVKKARETLDKIELLVRKGKSLSSAK